LVRGRAGGGTGGARHGWVEGRDGRSAGPGQGARGGGWRFGAVWCRPAPALAGGSRPLGSVGSIGDSSQRAPLVRGARVNPLIPRLVTAEGQGWAGAHNKKETPTARHQKGATATHSSCPAARRGAANTPHSTGEREPGFHPGPPRARTAQQTHAHPPTHARARPHPAARPPAHPCRGAPPPRPRSPCRAGPAPRALARPASPSGCTSSPACSWCACPSRRARPGGGFGAGGWGGGGVSWEVGCEGAGSGQFPGTGPRGWYQGTVLGAAPARCVHARRFHGR
jgi:hypothetical protein